MQVGFSYVKNIGNGRIYASVVPDGCVSQIDLMFVLDASGSIADAGYNSEKKFVGDVVKVCSVPQPCVTPAPSGPVRMSHVPPPPPPLLSRSLSLPPSLSLSVLLPRPLSLYLYLFVAHTHTLCMYTCLRRAWLRVRACIHTCMCCLLLSFVPCFIHIVKSSRVNSCFPSNRPGLARRPNPRTTTIKAFDIGEKATRVASVTYGSDSRVRS